MGNDAGQKSLLCTVEINEPRGIPDLHLSDIAVAQIDGRGMAVGDGADIVAAGDKSGRRDVDTPLEKHLRAEPPGLGAGETGAGANIRAERRYYDRHHGDSPQHDHQDHAALLTFLIDGGLLTHRSSWAPVPHLWRAYNR